MKRKQEMANKIIFQTNQYKMSSINFFTTFIFKFGGLWLLILSFIAVFALIIGISIDIRWLITGLMVIFILIPLIAVFIYYTFALKKECYVNTVSHLLEFTNEGVEAILMFKHGNIQDDDSQGETSSVTDQRNIFLPYSSMERIELNANALIILFKSPQKGFLWIPENAFDNKDLFFELLGFLHQKLILYAPT